MKFIYANLMVLLLLFSCKNKQPFYRVTKDFNADWQFYLGDIKAANPPNFEAVAWQNQNLPHDWSIEQGYQKEGAVASSTGFVPAGVGWYRKTFFLEESDQEKQIYMLFDGVYNNASVWINNHFLGTRPNGYISFQYNISNYVHYDGSQNIIAVKVDHAAYGDSRWYTGSGIYRKVKLIKTHSLHVKQYGTKITTLKANSATAQININTQLLGVTDSENKEISLRYLIKNKVGAEVASTTVVVNQSEEMTTQVMISNPKLWSIDAPNLYELETLVFENGIQVDNTTTTFGIRTFNFEANKGFFLNGKPTKIKGVNMHHDAGALGAAVPKSIWAYRVQKLKSIGVNAIRMSHNPHAPELLDVCDAQGVLVINEAFDEWNIPKTKSKEYLGDNKVSKEASKSYTTVFSQWAQQDLKDLICRDYNHPSVIMWSIGNEIEWTYPYYSKIFSKVNPEAKKGGYAYVPIYNKKTIQPIFEKHIPATDSLVLIAQQLTQWVKEEDVSRPTTCGSVLPSIGMYSGYGTAVDVYGFNYRRSAYDEAHKTYPNLKIYGSENWGTYAEWKAVKERDFVAGMFIWTGFAYLGEAGPWPRKGLNISLFDYAGIKTPRGHFFETLWKKDPKVYMVTTAEKESEFAYTPPNNWKFNIQMTPPPVWDKLRLWEWYKVYSKWKYTEGEGVVVQVYSNCETVELFLNETSLGRKKLTDEGADDHILKWLVPYAKGELKAVGYRNNRIADTYILNTSENTTHLKMTTNTSDLKADSYDTAVIEVALQDTHGNLVTDKEAQITFVVQGEGKNIGVDNGWEMNVQPHKSNHIITHEGKAVIFVQSTSKKGSIKVQATISNQIQEAITIKSI